jgi:ribonuclease P protein component
LKNFCTFGIVYLLVMSLLNSFSKSEHLCGEKRINRLFTDGEAFIAYPLRVVFLIEPKTDIEPLSILVSVPKKRFKRAVKRNILKRRIREAYRLNKQSICEKLNGKEIQIHIAFNYVSNDVLEYATIEKKMKLSLQKIIDKMESV